MIRYALTAVFAVLLCTVTILAKEVVGTIKSVDNDKNTVTVTVKDGDNTKDVTYKVAKDAKVTQKGKMGDETDVADGLKNADLKTRIEGGKARATLTTDNDDDSKASVTKIVVGGGKQGGMGGKKGGKKGKDM